MSEPCPFCSGSRYLSDLRELGPCVCVTPESVRELHGQLRAAGQRIAELEGITDGTVEDDLAHAQEAMSRYFSRMGFGRDPVVIDDPDLREAWARLKGD